MQKIIVIYHRADFDGRFCCEIARKFFSQTAEYLGWDYGDPVPEVPDGAWLYMLDISLESLMDFPGLVWIDHHKSAIEKYSLENAGYRIDGVAACRLAWQWFFGGAMEGRPVKTKDEFVARLVSEPVAVRLAGEYDVWDKRDPRAELLQHGLRSCDPDFGLLLANDFRSKNYVYRLLEAGKGIQFARSKENQSIINAQGFTVDFEGLKFLACNAARYNSHLFTAGLRPEHDGCLGFNYDGRGAWRVSLYGVPGKPDIDFSPIAVKYGGGGHRQACGFKVSKLPFVL